MIDRLIDS